MSLLTYNRLLEIVEQGIIKPALGYELNIGASSIDVRISDKILLESPAASVLELSKPNPKHLSQPVDLRESGYLIAPGQVFLTSTLETLSMPNNLAAKFVLRSSAGRMFINHMNSTMIQPGFEGSVTLELINSNRQHSIRFTPYAAIGQLEFYEVDPVPAHKMYSKTGQYSGYSLPQESLGIN